MVSEDNDASNADRPRDFDLGSFSDDPPWTIDRDELTWLPPLRVARQVVRSDLPRLTRSTLLPPAKRVTTVTRHLGWAMGRWAIGARRKGGAASRADVSRRLRIAAEALGPTYIKLAQIISGGEGLFPQELVNETKKCRDQVPSETWESIRTVVEEDLGRPIPEIFSHFERTPLAAASIAQVHRATLTTGEDVVVKVQRPTVATLVRQDLRVMAWIAPKLVGRIPISALANPPALVELFAETISEELDFRLEAENMLDVAESFAKLGQRDYVIPRPHPTLVTRRVLVMERLDGFKFDDVAGMKGAGVDTEKVVRTGMIGFMEGAFIHGIFHGDLHGGNLFVLPDGRTALLDFGITGRLDDRKRTALLRMLMSGTSNDPKGQLAAFRDLGALPMDTDLDAVVRDLGLDTGEVLDPTQMEADALVAEIQRTVKALLGYGARMPKELMLFVKNLMFVDGAIATLAPDLDILSEITEITMYFATTHGETIAEQLGMAQDAWQLDMDGVKAGMGLGEDVERLTYRDLQERRDTIRKRFEGRRMT
ncbi:MAG: AarF/UbiB family protein [Acidimicrobiales bacterium]|nr:AarF/UbiB family protein [Acidimicrobiales bacterium]